MESREQPPAADAQVLPAHAEHPRQFGSNHFVYPVLSRRSRGISVGINLNPDKTCNFDCVYCQVDRSTEADSTFVDTAGVIEELGSVLDLVESGRLFEEETFRNVPEPLRRLNDIAFSGDGEPTSFRNIDAVVEEVAAVKRRRGLDAVKLVMITNASLFQRPEVMKALATLDANNGEIWAKLDAGTKRYYEKVARTVVPFVQILNNLRDASRIRPIVIQSLFMKLDGVGPDEPEVWAYCHRLREILDMHGKIARVQVYTVARKPAETYVSPLSAEELESIAEVVRERLGLSVETFPGSAP